MSAVHILDRARNVCANGLKNPMTCLVTVSLESRVGLKMSEPDSPEHKDALLILDRVARESGASTLVSWYGNGRPLDDSLALFDEALFIANLESK